MTSLNNPSSRLFVGSLPYKFTEGELLALFIKFGRIVAVKIVHNRWGKSRGMGYVEFDNLDSAINAKAEMHNYKLEDRTIIVDYAQPDPFNTPEGQQRHEDALARRHSHRPHSNFNNPNRDDHPGHFSAKKSDTYSENNSSSEFVPRRKFGSESKFKKKSFSKSPENFEHARQTVYDSRHHGARVGAKFAHKSKKRAN